MSPIGNPGLELRPPTLAILWRGVEFHGPFDEGSVALDDRKQMHRPLIPCRCWTVGLGLGRKRHRLDARIGQRMRFVGMADEPLPDPVAEVAEAPDGAN